MKLKFLLIWLACISIGRFQATGQIIKPANYCSCQSDTTFSNTQIRWFRVNNVAVGDSVAVRLKSRSSMSLCVKIYPNGNINAPITFCQSNTFLLNKIIAIPAGVNFLNISVQSNNNYFGIYEIAIDKVNNSPCAKCIQCDINVFDTILCPPQLKSYKFGVQAGTIVDVNAYAFSNNGAPCLELRDSVGNILIKSACNSSQNKGFQYQFLNSGCYYLYCNTKDFHYPSNFRVTLNVFPGSGSCNSPVYCPNCNIPEICNNGLDDDLDGLIDCADSDCTPNASIEGDTFVCAGYGIPLVAKPAGMLYKWFNGATTANTYVYPQTTTQYWVQVKKPGGCSDTAYTTVLVIQQPSVEITGNTSFCEGGNTTLTAKPDNMKYVWNNGSSTQSIQIDSAGFYHVTVTDNYGCSAFTGKNVSEITNPVASISGNSNFCPGGITTLTASPAFGVTWLWSTGATSSSIAVNASGIYTVTVTKQNTICTGSASKTVVEHPSVTANILSIPLNGLVCKGDTLILQGTTNAVNAAFHWNGPIGFNSNAQTVTIPNIGTNQAGVYNLTVTNTGTFCTKTATQAISVSSPQIFNVTGGGQFCEGEAGLPVGLNGSKIGVNYTLFRSGINVITVPGTGLSIPFGNQTASGIYSVIATDTATGCTATMSGIAEITVLISPQIFNVTGGGSICIGNPGPEIGLDGSQTVVQYQLKRNGFNIGAPKSGTGGPISFGSQSLSGNYTIVANNANPQCARTMNGNAVVDLLQLPIQFNVTGGGNYCLGNGGLPVGLSGSELGVTYQLYYNGEISGKTLVGSGSPLSFGIQSATGIYSIVATNPNTGCSNSMPNIVTIQLIPNPIVNISGPNHLCLGEFATLAATGGIEYQWSTGGNAPTIPISPTSDTTYFVTVTNSQGCTASDSIKIEVTVVTATTNPLMLVQLGSSFSLNVETNIGNQFQWTGPNGFSAAEKEPQITNASSSHAGLYSVTVRDSITGCSSTGSILVEVTVSTVEPLSYWGITILPNPNAGSFEIQIKEGEGKPLMFSLYSQYGAHIETFKVEADSKICDFPSLPSGKYLLWVSNGDKAGNIWLAITR